MQNTTVNNTDYNPVLPLELKGREIKYKRK